MLERSRGRAGGCAEMFSDRGQNGKIRIGEKAPRLKKRNGWEFEARCLENKYNITPRSLHDDTLLIFFFLLRNLVRGSTFAFRSPSTKWRSLICKAKSSTSLKKFLDYYNANARRGPRVVSAEASVFGREQLTVISRKVGSEVRSLRFRSSASPAALVKQ